MNRKHHGSDTLEDLLTSALVGAVAWRTFVYLIEHSNRKDFFDMRFCWFITSCTIITDSALGTGYCRPDPQDGEPSSKAREDYIDYRQEIPEWSPHSKNAEQFPFEYTQRVRAGLNHLAYTLIDRGGRKYSFVRNLFGFDPRRHSSLRDKCRDILQIPYIQSPLHDLDQAISYVEELHTSPVVQVRQTLNEILLRLGVPPDRLELVHETTQRLSLIGPQKAITDTYSGLVIPFTVAKDLPQSGMNAYVKIARVDEIHREYTYLCDAARHPELRAITPPVIGCISIEHANYAVLVTLDTKNQSLVDIQDQCAYFTLKQRVFQRAGIPAEVYDAQHVIDVFNRALAHTLLASHKDDIHYASSPFALVHPWEILEERLSSCQSKSTRQSFQRLKTPYKQVQPRVREYAFDTPTTIIHGDARPENIWESPLGVRPLGDASHARAGNPEFDVGKSEVSPIHALAKLYLALRTELEREIHNTTFVLHTSPADFVRRVVEISFLNAARYGMWKAGQNVDPSHYLLLTQLYQQFVS